jgi:hypothetical protein
MIVIEPRVIGEWGSRINHDGVMMGRLNEINGDTVERLPCCNQYKFPGKSCKNYKWNSKLTGC